MLHKDNNLNLLRLVAALMVLYAHSFDIYGNSPEIFIGLDSYGGLGIAIFFVISGYLIAKSWSFDPSVISFLVKRSLRIFPALIVVVVVTSFLLGPIFSTLTVKQYFSNLAFIMYLKNIILSPVFYLPGVLEHARVVNVINGSLWSLPIEFFMYLVVVALGLLFNGGRLVYAIATALFALIVVFWCWRDAPLLVVYGTDVRNIPLIGIYFMIGACYAKWGLERWFSLSGVTVMVMMTLLLAPYSSISKPLLWLTLPYVVLAYGLSRSWLGSLVNKVGDCSYGVYIYAFPVQQFVLLKFPGIAYSTYLVVTVVITLILGYGSWHLIEKRVLKFKPKNKVRSVSNGVDADSAFNPVVGEKLNSGA
ncbi:acyltransferase family protein [Pseudomonas mandelii]|uniref:Acyltransferase n=1 Tax=Pseudomonas mandelii TaxID=75612 RepID=A0A502HYZ1_9PSED|nr:acyltransferase [Pseudomonas mandelii]TPG78592.1 acyltransferase [Pseudomonas mandelii]